MEITRSYPQFFIDVDKENTRQQLIFTESKKQYLYFGFIITDHPEFMFCEVNDFYLN